MYMYIVFNQGISTCSKTTSASYLNQLVCHDPMPLIGHSPQEHGIHHSTSGFFRGEKNDVIRSVYTRIYMSVYEDPCII